MIARRFFARFRVRVWRRAGVVNAARSFNVGMAMMNVNVQSLGSLVVIGENGHSVPVPNFQIISSSFVRIRIKREGQSRVHSRNTETKVSGRERWMTSRMRVFLRNMTIRSPSNEVNSNLAWIVVSEEHLVACVRSVILENPSLADIS